MSADFYEQALRRVRLLTLGLGLTGTVAALVVWGFRPAAGFLVGAALSILNFQGLSMLVNVLGGSAKPGPLATVLIGLRYLLIGCAIYVIVKILGVTPAAVVWGLLTAFAAVILEILYELIFVSMNDNWLTAIFNKYLAGTANAALGLFGMTALDTTHPWETWLVMELLVVAIIMVTVALVRSSLSVDNPGKLQHAFEGAYGFLNTQAEEVGIEHPKKYLNFFATLFVFILAMNLIGIIPGFESPTMSVYVAAGLALCTWVYYHAMGVRELGVWKYLAQFMGPVWWLAWLMIPIEIIGHFARTLSLTVRLYANMFAGDQITNVFITLTYLIAPVAFMALHVLVAFLQAYIFTLLTMIYVSIGTSHEH